MLYAVFLIHAERVQLAAQTQQQAGRREEQPSLSQQSVLINNIFTGSVLTHRRKINKGYEELACSLHLSIQLRFYALILSNIDDIGNGVRFQY